MDSSDRPAISLTNVSVHFGGTAALCGIDLTVGPTERVGLLGRSGAGKSTLLRLINGTVIPSTGTVSVFGVDLSTLHERQLLALRRRIALVAQGLDLPRSLQVVHNVNAGRVARWSTARALASLIRPYRIDDVRAALALVELDGFEHRRTEELSGGEQQRVAVARALISDAELLLADEPVANLDPELASTIVTALSPANPTRSSVISLHQPELARRHCDRVVGLMGGAICFDVPAAELTDDLLAVIYRDNGS